MSESTYKVDCPQDVDAQVWADWLTLRKSKKAPPTQTVIRMARREAVKASITFERFLEIWCVRGSQGLMADWLKPAEIGRQAETAWQRSQRETVEVLTGGLVSRKQSKGEIDGFVRITD